MMYPNQAFSSGSYAEMLSGSHLLPHNYSESVGGPNEVKFITATGETVTMQSFNEHSNAAAGDQACNSFAGDSHVEHNAQCQSLSLSLGTLMPPTASVPPFQYQYPGTAGLTSIMTEANLHKELRSAECMASVSSGGFHDSFKRDGLYNQNPSVCLKDFQSDPCLQGSQGFSNSVLNSQYLKAAQELLDEIVSVRKALKQPGMEKQEKFRDIGLDGSKDSDGKSTSQSVQVSSGPNGSIANPSSELSPAERQNLLEKKTKLLSILDEVDKRYRQYCHQMQMVVSTFDMVAGCGAAEPYTTLALRTISRHFRCLRDTISGQIQATQRSLGEQEGIPRLRYVDQQLRQQKALQQLGVMRHAWRPQRGLPESSVSILRAWLFEHFLHPYPKDSEKLMLARQTGLTRNQVANWFINARVRLWKPMVEEMYKEEFGEFGISCNLPAENMPKGKRDDAQASDDKGEESQDNLVTVDSVQQGELHGFKSEHASSSNAELDRGGIQLQSSNNGLYSCAPIQTNQNGGGSIMDSTTAAAAATYDLSELGNFTVGGGHVSLALELRNCESDGFVAMSDDAIHKRRNQALASSPETDLLDYHFTDSGKQQHRFSNPHLLHEFVV